MVEIEPADVVRLIAQFLREQKLHASLAVLQKESGVTLGTVDDVDALCADVMRGRWDVVLAAVEQACVPAAKRVGLYEHVVMELAEQRDLAPARALLRQTEPMEIMRATQPDRYLRLERLLSQTSFDAGHAYGGARESRRRAVADELAAEVRAAPPSRLLTLLGQAVAWQQRQGLVPAGAPLSLFLGQAQPAAPGADRAPRRPLAEIKFAKGQHPNCAAFSPCGAYLATGSTDGFVELWSTLSWKPAPELGYQAAGAPLMMDGAVTAVAFSRAGRLVCSGSSDGRVKVWAVESGACTRRFAVAPNQPICSVAFSADDAQVLVAFGSVLRVYGLQSGAMLRELQGHAAPVTSALFSADGRRVISTSEDGSVRIWDAATAACLHSLAPGSDDALAAPATHSAALIPGSPSEFAVLTKSPAAYVVSTDGCVRRRFEAAAAPGACSELLAGAVSPAGRYILAVSGASILHCFDLELGSARAIETPVPGPEVLGIAAHPKLNIAVFFSHGRRLPIWSA